MAKETPDHEAPGSWLATPESIAAAKQANARERATFTAQTGLDLDDDGRIGLLIGNVIYAAVHGLRTRG